MYNEEFENEKREYTVASKNALHAHCYFYTNILKILFFNVVYT